MKTDVLAPLFAALGHETRLKVFALLAQSGSYAASELAQATGLSPSALSFHLKDLRLAGLVDHRREGRQVFYQADQNAVDLLAHFLLRDCGPDPTAPDSRLPDILELLLSPGRQAEEQASGGKGRRGTAHPRQVLFLCTGNSARSIMAESLLRHFGQDRFVAHSAGSHPRGEIDSVTLEVLKAHGLPTTNLRSKSWEGFSEDSHAKPLDIIITVCDNAAQEPCPSWPGQPLQAHWGVEDPALEDLSATERVLRTIDVLKILRSRIAIFCALPLEALDRYGLQRKLSNLAAFGKAGPSTTPTDPS